MPGCGGLCGLRDVDVFRRHRLLFVFELPFGRSASSCSLLLIAVTAPFWRVLPVFPPELADGVINRAPDLVAQLTQLVTERKRTLVLIPLFVPFGLGLRIIPLICVNNEDKQ